MHPFRIWKGPAYFVGLMVFVPSGWLIYARHGMDFWWWWNAVTVMFLLYRLQGWSRWAAKVQHSIDAIWMRERAVEQRLAEVDRRKAGG